MIIILHSPQLPENIGAVARVMGNFHVPELRLITPNVDVTHEKALATAAGAETILHHARVFPSMSDAIADIHHLWGTCADDRVGVRQYQPPRQFMEQEYVHDTEKTAILFGCERTGLSKDILSRCKGTLRIPVDMEFSSMNLSHAVAILCYEYFLKKKADNPEKKWHLGGTTLATIGEKESFFHQLIQSLDQGNYWRLPSKKPLMQQNLANLFFRLDLTSQDVRTLFGIVHTLKRPRK